MLRVYVKAVTAIPITATLQFIVPNDDNLTVSRGVAVDPVAGIAYILDVKGNNEPLSNMTSRYPAALIVQAVE